MTWLPVSLRTRKMLRAPGRWCVAVSHEHPKCRAAIRLDDLRPQVADGVWTGRAVNPDDEPVMLTEGMRQQMRRMIAEGVWK